MDFPALDTLRQDLSRVNALEVESLRAYYDTSIHGFAHLTPKPGENNFSIASSVTCAVALISTGLWDEFERAVNPNLGSSEPELLAVLDHILAIDPETIESAQLGPGNPFTLAFALELVKKASNELSVATQPVPEAKVDDWISSATARLIGNLRSTHQTSTRPEDGWADAGSAHLDNFRPTTFLTQLVVRALKARPSASFDLSLSDDIAHWSWRQLLEEFALLSTGRRGADPLALAYAVMVFMSVRDSSKLSLDEVRIIRKALEAFFSSQLPDGGWQQSRPLHFYPKIGNAYCFDYEVLTQLLQCGQLQKYLLDFLPALEKAFRYAEAHWLPIADTGKSWSSGHHPHLREAESWSTASVYHFVHMLDRLVAEAVRIETFRYLGAQYTAPKAPPMTSREGEKFFKAAFLDSNIQLDGAAKSLTDVFLRRFLEPLARDARNVELGRGFPKKTAISGILFGPPGTSKTQLAGIVAGYLRWPLLPIDPSHLVRKGLDQVQAESNHVFAMLGALEQVVVFLDEFDELVLERTSPRATMLSRFLTTAMLPKLTSISESRRVVFLLATNYVSKFDFAIRRPGRFDVLVQVMPPTWRAKCDSDRFRAVCQRINTFLQANKPPPSGAKWQDILEQLAYKELEAISDDIKAALDDDQVAQILQSAWQRATLNQPMKSESANAENWGKQCSNEAATSRFL
jgi:hypothetical protein